MPHGANNNSNHRHGFIAPPAPAPRLPARLRLPSGGNRTGSVPDANAHVLLETSEDVAIEVTFLSLYNPNTTDSNFLLRFVIPILASTGGPTRASGQEYTIRSWDDSILTLDNWIFGTLGATFTLHPPGQRLEFILDSAPTKPIEFYVEFLLHREPTGATGIDPVTGRLGRFNFGSDLEIGQRGSPA